MDDIFYSGNTPTNSHAKDEAGDQALLDLVPIPGDSQKPDTETYDPFDGVFGI